MRFELTILGCNAAIPAFDRHPSAMVLNVREKLFLIDCGEGTQIQMNRYNIKRSRINHLFISHLHGDHIFGLAGLLTSMSLAGRTEGLAIFSPDGLEQMVRLQLKLSHSFLTYPLQFTVVDTTQSSLVFEDEDVEVSTIPLKHRIPTAGYLFREKPRPLNVIPEKLKAYQIPVEAIKFIKKGNDYIDPDGKVIAVEELTLPPFLPRSFAYCSDTAYLPDLIPLIRGVDLLYHETTFGEEKLEQAHQTMHSTAKQAAQIAKAAEVGQLLMGHYSSRYANLDGLHAEATAVFPSTVLGVEGQRYSVEARREA